jgi:hypothetical protein
MHTFTSRTIFPTQDPSMHFAMHLFVTSYASSLSPLIGLGERPPRLLAKCYMDKPLEMAFDQMASGLRLTSKAHGQDCCVSSGIWTCIGGVEHLAHLELD